MTTRICPNCRAQYVASVRRCIDCDVSLVEEEATAGPDGAAEPTSAAPVGSGDQIAYELSGWGSQLKVSLEGMLDNAGIRRVWEAGALVVPAADEETVDALVAELEGAEADELPEGSVQVAFEIEGVTAEELTDLDAELLAAQIAHGWDDEGALLVAEADQDAVAELIDQVLAADPGAQGDGLALMERLTDLFVVVDKLAKDPCDERQVRRYHAAAEPLAGLGVPYGLTQGSWDGLLAQIAATGALLDEGPDGTDGGADDSPGAEDDETEAGEDEPEPVTAEDRARDAIADLRSRLQELV